MAEATQTISNRRRRRNLQSGGDDRWVVRMIDNPWEIARNDVSYPVKFYGKVVTRSDGKMSWIGGEDIVAVAHDVPIPGYQTKTTINLRLWSTNVHSDQLDLFAFNDGEHTKACEAQANAEKLLLLHYHLSWARDTCKLEK
ncbi:hypothetical protein ACS0TY_035708 [Phlomoides rotata]